MNPTIWDILQTAVFPLLAIIWWQNNVQIKELKNWVRSQQRQLDEIKREYVSRDECHERHDPLDRILGNGLQENVHCLRERVAVLESRQEQKETDT